MLVGLEMHNAGRFIAVKLLDYLKTCIVALAKLQDIEQLDCKFHFLHLRDNFFHHFNLKNNRLSDLATSWTTESKLYLVSFVLGNDVSSNLEWDREFYSFLSIHFIWNQHVNYLYW